MTYQFNGLNINRSKRTRFKQLRLRIENKYSKKPLRLKLKNRFFYLFPNSAYFGRIIQRIRAVGQFRIRLLSAYTGFGLNLSLLKSCPKRLNYLVFNKLSLFIHKNFLTDQAILRFIKRRIKQKMKPGTVYNVRVLRGLPVRGQRNKTNSRSARSYFKRLKLAAE